MSKKVGKKDNKEDGKKNDVKSLGKIDLKTWILVGVSVVTLAIVIALIINFSQAEKYDSSYFHDSDGKIVVTMGRDAAALDDSIYEPDVTHVVYYYDGNNINNVKAFYEYANEKDAKIAFEHLGLGTFADSKNLNGRFVIFQVKRSMYDNLTTDALREDIEELKSIDALILDYGDGYINKFIERSFSEDSDE